MSAQPHHYVYTSILSPRFFRTSQSISAPSSTADADADAVTSDLLDLIVQPYKTDYSLPKSIPRPASNWTRFLHHLECLNRDNAFNAARATKTLTTYHVLILARHGQGVHNLAEEYFGTEAWNACYSFRDEIEGVRMTDARLSKIGRMQTKTAGTIFNKLEAQGVHVEGVWVSPLVRACESVRIAWGDAIGDFDSDIKPKGIQDENGTASSRTKRIKVLIKEGLREQVSGHTCDRRSKRTEIQALYPDYEIEQGFVEEDEMWRPDFYETHDIHTERTLFALDDIFSSCLPSGKPSVLATPGEYRPRVVQITSHNGTINAILRGLKHQAVLVNVGGCIAVCVGIQKILGRREPSVFEAGSPVQIQDEIDLQLGKERTGYETFTEYVHSVETTAE